MTRRPKAALQSALASAAPAVPIHGGEYVAQEDGTLVRGPNELARAEQAAAEQQALEDKE